MSGPAIAGIVLVSGVMISLIITIICITIHQLRQLDINSNYWKSKIIDVEEEVRKLKKFHEKGKK